MTMQSSKKVKKSKKPSRSTKQTTTKRSFVGVFATRRSRLTTTVLVALIFGGFGLYLLLGTRAATTGDIPLTGDWDGNGTFTPGVFRQSEHKFYLNNQNDKNADIIFSFGRSTDQPVTGDWNGDGKTEVGVKRASRWYLKSNNDPNSTTTIARFDYGIDTDEGVTGDWDGDGKTTIGVRRGSTWYLRNSNTAGPGQIGLSFGRSTDQPVTGDWNGDGKTEVGVKRASRWYLKSNNDPNSTTTIARFDYGIDTDEGVTGDWDGDGKTTIGVRRGSTWYLRNSNTAGEASVPGFTYGKTDSTSSSSAGTTVGGVGLVGHAGYPYGANCVMYVHWVLTNHITSFDPIWNEVGATYASHLISQRGWISKKAPHSVVSFTKGTSSSAGHVALVYRVNSDGSIDVEHSNWPLGTVYATGHFTASQLSSYGAVFAYPPSNHPWK